MKKQRYTLLLVVAILYLIIFIVDFDFIMLLAAILFFVLYYKIEKKPKKNKKNANSTKISTTKSAQINKPVPNIEPPSIDEITIANPILDEPTITEAVPAYKTENHRVTGTSHYVDAIESLGSENYYYDLTKKEFIDEVGENERQYEYLFAPQKVELIEEPTNQHDPNAIKVAIDGVLVGYIKQRSCSRIKNLLRSNLIEAISAEIGGGRYKILYSEYDYDKEKDVYELEKGETNYFVTVTLKLKTE